MKTASKLLFCSSLILLLEGRCAAQIVSLIGDFNSDGVVNASDLDTWVSEFGDLGFAADANGDGVTDIDDLYIWKANEGATAAIQVAAGSAAAPEVIYNASSGGLTFRPNGHTLYAFKISTFAPSVLNVTNAGFPGPDVWDVRSLFSSTSVQGFDSSILGDVSPVTSDYSLDQLGMGVVEVARLTPGLEAGDFDSLSFGNVDGAIVLATLRIVPEPFASLLGLAALCAATCGIRQRRLL